MKNKQKITISVIGSHDSNMSGVRLAHEVGYVIGKMDCVLVCGGLGGVMEIASKGAKEAGGLTIGLLPGKVKKDANPYIDIALPTSIGYARNAFVACASDIIIALPGSHGTNSEICYGLIFDRVVLDMGDWNIPGMEKVNSIQELETSLKRHIANIKSSK